MRHVSFISDMTHSYMTRLIHIRHVSFIWDMSHSYPTCLIHTWIGAHFCVPWLMKCLIQIRHILYTKHVIFRIWDMSDAYISYIHLNPTSYLTCLICLIYETNAPSHVWRIFFLNNNHVISQGTLRCLRERVQHTATHCNTLQHTAAHCNTRMRQVMYERDMSDMKETCLIYEKVMIKYERISSNVKSHTWVRHDTYRVVKTLRMAYLHRSFSAKEPYN